MSDTKKSVRVPVEVASDEVKPEEAEESASRNGAGGTAEESDATESSAVESSAAESSGAESNVDEQPEELSEFDRAIAERDQAVDERNQLVDQLQRTQADFENIRKRLYKEKDEIVQYAASDTINSLLPIIDDFERAIETEGLDPEIKKGLELIHKRMFEVFSRAGLREVEEHDEFDPHLHFAVDRAPAEDGQDDQTILEVYQKGYHFKERLLRASMVKVAVKE